jgi:hypothetical protein
VPIKCTEPDKLQTFEPAQSVELWLLCPSVLVLSFIRDHRISIRFSIIKLFYLCMFVLFLGGTRTRATKVQKEAKLGVHFIWIIKILFCVFKTLL